MDSGDISLSFLCEAAVGTSCDMSAKPSRAEQMQPMQQGAFNSVLLQ